MRFKALTALALFVMFVSAVNATYTATYDISDAKDAGIDLGSSIIVGIAGQAYDIGDILGTLMLIIILVILIMALLGIPQKILGFVKSFK